MNDSLNHSLGNNFVVMYVPRYVPRYVSRAIELLENFNMFQYIVSQIMVKHVLVLFIKLKGIGT